VTEPDDELVRALRQAAAPVAPVDTEAALSRVRSRSLVVRRRRATVSGAALVVAGVAFGSIWLASRPADQTQVDTVSSPTSPIASTVATTVPTTLPTTVVTTVPTTPPTIAPTAPVANPVLPPSVPTQTSSPRSGSAPVTFRGAGGSVTARVQGSALQLLSVQPAAGYRVTEQQVDPDEIDVRFESDAGRTRVKLRLVQGRISPELDESANDEGGDHGGTAPVLTEPDDAGGPGDDGGASDGGEGGGAGFSGGSDGGSSDGGAQHGHD
jgi:uncharacterized membrane protein YgcG